MLISGVGLLNRPSIPDIPNLARFDGPVFHSARWDHSVDIRGKTLQLEVYDPTYFAAITFAQNQPVKLVGADAGCESFVHRPEPLDPSIASQLAAIPASQRKPPPELFAVTDKLVNATRVTCK